MKPGRHGCLLDVAGIDLPHPPSLGSVQHDELTLRQVGQRVHQSVDEVAVILAPPQDPRIDDVAVVLVLELGATDLLDRQTEVLIDVLVISVLLDYLSSGKAKLCHRTVRRRGFRGRNHECSPLTWTPAPAAIVGYSCA